MTHKHSYGVFSLERVRQELKHTNFLINYFKNNKILRVYHSKPNSLSNLYNDLELMIYIPIHYEYTRKYDFGRIDV